MSLMRPSSVPEAQPEITELTLDELSFPLPLISDSQAGNGLPL